MPPPASIGWVNIGGDPNLHPEVTFGASGREPSQREGQECVLNDKTVAAFQFGDVATGTSVPTAKKAYDHFGDLPHPCFCAGPCGPAVTGVAVKRAGSNHIAEQLLPTARRYSSESI